MSLNFDSVDELTQFFLQLENLKDNGERRYLAGFFKSHFYAQFMESFLTQDRKFIYIVRNPVDTLISFWKFLHQYAGEKGAAEKLYGKSICEFLELSPTESCFRYQNKHFNDYFSRWADNVEGWLEMKDKHANIIFVKYENLKNHYTPTMNVILKAFGYEEQKFCKKPARNEYFRGKELVVPGDELRKIEKIIYRKLGERPKLSLLYQK